MQEHPPELTIQLSCTNNWQGAGSLAPCNAWAKTPRVLLEQATASEQRVTSRTPAQRAHCQLAWQLCAATSSLARLFPPSPHCVRVSPTGGFPPNTRLPLTKPSSSQPFFGTATVCGTRSSMKTEIIFVKHSMAFQLSDSMQTP